MATTTQPACSTELDLLPRPAPRSFHRADSAPCSTNTNTTSASSPPHPDVCVICLEPPSERAVCVPCNHCSFDFLCLASWAQEHATCPLCKAVLTAIEYDWRGPNDYKRYHVAPGRDAPQALPGPAARLRAVAARRRPHRPVCTGRPAHIVQTPYHASDVPSATAAAASEAAISRRRRVYRQQLFSQRVGSNRVSRYRDFTPVAFARSPALQSRARAWVRRELRAFDLGPANAEFVLAYVVAMLGVLELKGAGGAAVERLGELLGVEHAALFLHELESWLRSPFERIEDWDRRVQYCEEDKGRGRE